LNIIYENTETSSRGYHGLYFEETECRNSLKCSVKDNLNDREERESGASELRGLLEGTGFRANDQLMIDIQALENADVDVQNFRIGEAYAEVVLEEHFSCRFHWNERRDARNPKGNKTGADLVGFIEIDGQVLFLFGEVKTSSENHSPPQVMINRDGIVNQLQGLYDKDYKRRDLIRYLTNKARALPDGHQFKNDLHSGINSYYNESGQYQLVGVLIRDVAPNERDISTCYSRLKENVLEPAGLRLLALYLSIPKEEWLNIINAEEPE
jgi:hypothetical protein